MPISSNRRQRLVSFETPKVADLVLIEVVDSSIGKEQLKGADYGDAHPDAARFPNHKLAYIKEADEEQGQFQEWYYVVARANQDDYNWEFSAAGGANPRYDTIVRTYVTLRSAYKENEPKIGYNTATDSEANLKLGMRKDSLTFMPATTAPFTTGAAALIGASAESSGSVLFNPDYIFFERKQVRAGEEVLDTLFVVEQRVFVKKIPIRRIDVDDTFPYTGFNSNDSPQTVVAAPTGGLVSKETIFHKDEPIVATIEFKKEDSVTAGGARIGTGDGDEPPGELTGSDVRQNSSGDPTASEAFAQSDIAYKYGSNKVTNFWGIDDHGIMREGKQLSDNWYALSEKQVIQTDDKGVVASFTTMQDYSWPAVLHGGDDNPLTGDDDSGGIVSFSWTRREGGADSVVVPVYAREAYRGPTKIKIDLAWRKIPWDNPEAGSSGSATPPTMEIDKDDAIGYGAKLSHVIPMQPKTIVFTTPLITMQTKPCLHKAISLMVTTGTEHPIWELAGAEFDYDETNFTDWPTHLIISDTQKSFRGGYLRERVTAYAPTTED